MLVRENVHLTGGIYGCANADLRSTSSSDRLNAGLDGSVQILLIFLLSLLIFGSLEAQIFDWDRPNPYRKVFVQTDDFDTSYLSVLEDALPLVSTDTLSLSIINDLAYYWHTRNLNTAADYVRQGLQKARVLNASKWEGRLRITQGSILLRAEKLDSAELVLEQARSQVPRADLPFLYTQLGYVMERRGILDKAADYAKLGLQLGEELDDKKAIALALSDLSNLFWKQAKYQDALEYGLRSEEVFKQRGLKDLDYGFTLYVIGNVYLAVKQYDQAINYFQRSNEISEQYGFYNNLSDTYISLIELYTEKKDFESAQQASLQAIKYAELIQNNFLLMRAWLSVGKLENLQGNYQSAIISLRKSLTVASEDFGDEFFLQMAYGELADALAKTESYKEAYEALLHYDQLKDSVFTAASDERISQIKTEFEVAQKERTIADQENRLKQSAKMQMLTFGFVFMLLVTLFIVYHNYLGNKRINKKLKVLNSDLNRKNLQLDRKNEENKLLVKEVHHRVKNNLEVVSSLLELQSAELSDPNVQDAITASQNRVQSMGIIHQKLYQGQDLASIEMKDYFKNLGENIADSFGNNKNIQIDLVMPEIELDVDVAVPIGLIVNELLTNAFKYAFPHGQAGTLVIKLEAKDPDSLYLEVADDGVGKEMEGSPRGTGFGSRLIELLTMQLNGIKTEAFEGGTKVAFLFSDVKVIRKYAN